MSDSKPLEQNDGEKLGEYLKRARKAAGIEVGELAREIRITPEMLTALEEGQYEKLPVSAYVRGYLNTICNRLDLNREKILNWYHKESGQPYQSSPAMNNFGVSSDSDSQTPPPAPNPNKAAVPVLLLLLAALFAVVLYMQESNSPAFNSSPEEEKAMAAEDTSQTTEAQKDSSSTDTVIAPKKDSISALQKDTVTVKKVSAPKKTQVVEEEEEEAKEVPEVEQETVIKLECTKDSTWVRVKKSGGLPWDRFIRAGDKPRYVSHTDTMMVNIGSPEKTIMYLNKQKTDIPPGIFYVFNGKVVEKKKD